MNEVSAEPKPLGRRWRKGGKAASRARGVWESHRHPGPSPLRPLPPVVSPPRCMARSPPSPGVGKRRGSKPGCQMDGTLAPAEPLKGPPCCTAGYSLMSGAGNMSSFFIRYSPACPPACWAFSASPGPLPPGVLQQACGQRCRNCPTTHTRGTSPATTLSGTTAGYVTFRLDFHRFDRFKLDLRAHAQP